MATPSDLAVGYGTVMDSGTTFTYVPSNVFHATAAALDAAVTQLAPTEKKLAKVPGPDPSYPDDVCFQREGATEIEPIVTMANLGEYYPPLTIAFDGEGASLVLPPSNYLFVHGKTRRVLPRHHGQQAAGHAHRGNIRARRARGVR